MEKNEEIFRLAIKQLKKLFYILFTITIIFSLVVLLIVHRNGAWMTFNKQFQFIIENITYLLILIGIPGIYYIHQKNLKAIESMDSSEEKLKHYKTSFFIKIMIAESLIFISCILFLLQGTLNFLIIIAISLIYLLLNIPTFSKLASELHLNEDKNEEPEENEPEN